MLSLPSYNVVKDKRHFYRRINRLSYTLVMLPKSFLWRISFFKTSAVGFLFVWILTACCFILLFRIWSDYGIGKGDQAFHQQQRYDQSQGNIKRILFWNEYFQSRKYEFGLGQEPFIKAGCQFSNCMTTDDRQLLNISDAILFHASDFDELDFPDLVFRRPNQRYIFYNYETCIGEKDMPIFVWTKDFFNWTMTYRRDSDIYDPHPYGSIRRRSDASRPPLVMPSPLHQGWTSAYPATLIQPRNKSRPFLNKKKKMVAWFVSHCHTNGLREEYFGELGKFVEIDIYGHCGKLNCLPSKSLKCDQLLDSYKFYIAAENAICTDYVTEKFYRAMASDIVPIVYGGADYSSYAPPLSYIDVSDFKSHTDLASYLKLLDENDALYLKYFDWKKDYEVVNRPVMGWCDLCEKLNDPHQRPKVYKDISDWWFQNDMACVSGDDFLQSSLGADRQQRRIKSK